MKLFELYNDIKQVLAENPENANLHVLISRREDNLPAFVFEDACPAATGLVEFGPTPKCVEADYDIKAAFIIGGHSTHFEDVKN